MAMSKIALQITSDPTGLERGVEESRRAIALLREEMASLKNSTNDLKTSTDGIKTLVGFDTFLRVAGIVKDAAAAFISMASAASQSIDVLSKLADRTGRTYTEMASLEIAGNLAGVGVDQLAKSLTKADVMFNNARSGSKSAQEAFANLGLSLDELGRESSQQRFTAIGAAIAKLPDPAARAAASMQIFGKAGADLLPVFAGIEENLAQATADAKNFGLALTNAQGKDVEAMNDAWTRAGYAISGVVTQVVAQLSPAVAGVVDMFTKFIGDATGGAIGAGIVDAVFNVAEFFARIVDFWVSGATIVGNIIGPVFSFFGSLLPGWESTTSIFGSAVEVYFRAISLYEGVGKSFIAGWSTTIGYFSKAVSYAVGAFANIVEKLGYSSDKIRELQKGVDAFGSKALETGASFGTAAGNDIANAFSTKFKPSAIGDAILNGVDNGTESMVEQWRRAADEARKKLDGSTVNGAADAAELLETGINDGASTMIDNFQKEMKNVNESQTKNIRDAGEQSGRAAGEAIADAVSQVSGALDTRSRSGVNEIVRMMNYGNSDIAKRQLHAMEQAAELLDKIAGDPPMVANIA